MTDEINEKLPHLADEELVILPARCKFLQHGRFTLLSLDGRQHLLLEIMLIDVPVAVVELVRIVVGRFLCAHGIAVSVCPEGEAPRREPVRHSQGSARALCVRTV